MAYFLKHFFDPHFDHTHLKPTERQDGSVDHQNLGYVQNVVKTQILAEWVQVPPGEQGRFESEYLADEPLDVAGKNCGPNPEDPHQIVSNANGYVFYLDGKITVHRLLNVRRDVDYHTGNIFFVGDMVVHGSVRAGFHIRANSVRVKGVVDGARINAMDSVACEGGIKGGGKALIKAGRTIKTSFCENALLKAVDNVVVDGACMHSVVFAGHKFASKGRVTGGSLHCYEFAYIGGQLGGGMGAETNVMAGYDPVLLFADQRVNEQITQARIQIDEIRGQMGKDDSLDQELQPALEAGRKRLDLLLERKTRIWDKVGASEKLDSCRIMVAGKVHPGVEISIGPAWYRVEDYMEDVHFYLEDLEIKIGSPALKK